MNKIKWGLSLFYTILLYIIIWFLFFFVPGKFLISKLELSNDKSVNYHIAFHQPLSKLVPLYNYKAFEVDFPLDTNQLPSALVNTIYKNNNWEINNKKKIKLADITKISFLPHTLIRSGSLLFGYIQFVMIFLFVAMFMAYKWRSKSYQTELKNKVDELKAFTDHFVNSKITNKIEIVRSLNNKNEIDLTGKDVLTPNDLASINISTTGHIYDLESSIIRDFYSKGKDSAISRLSYVSEQLELDHENKIRRLEWALFIIPTIGFIGTVLGISDALGSTSSIFDSTPQEGIPVIASKLSLAFDTTFIALVTSVLMFSWKRSLDAKFYQEFLEKFNLFNYQWIIQSYEIKDLHKVERKRKEYQEYIQKLLTVFNEVNSKLQDAININFNNDKQ